MENQKIKVSIIRKIFNDSRCFEVGEYGVTHIVDASTHYPLFHVFIDNVHHMSIHNEPMVAVYDSVWVEDD